MHLPTLTRRRLLASTALAWGIAATGMAQAADRTIHIVVPFGAGAVQDTVLRAFSNELGQALQASIVIENKPGAGGTLGTQGVARAKPDGNTLVMAAASHNFTGHMYPKLGFHPVNDFEPVALVASSGYVIAAPAGQARNLAQWVAAAKASPTPWNYASAGNGSASHLGMASFLAQAKLEQQHIPYKSTGDAVRELLAGRVQGVTAATTGLIAFKDDPRVQLLAYTGPKRSPFLPDLPTVAESGFPGFQFDTWYGLLAPAGTPAAEVGKLNAAVNKVLADPVVQERVRKLGAETATDTPAGFKALLAKDWVTAGNVVKVSGARVE